MSKWILAAGAAAIALTPALAGPGNGHGGGSKAQGGGGPAQGDGGGDGPKAERGGSGGGQMRAEQGNGGGRKAERQVMRAERQVMRVEHGNGGAKHAERQFARVEHRAMKPAKVEHGNAQRFDGQADKRQAQAFRDLERGDDRVRGDDRRFADNERRIFGGLGDSCPPGLAMKNNGCLPPGQAKKLIGATLPAGLSGQLLSGPYSQWYRDDDRYYYRNDGDYIYRVNRDGGLINALFPYQDRDYSYYPIGMTYPADYNSYNVPYQYQSFYPDGNDYNYRYGDGAIYQVNRSSNSIESIVALLAGDLGVGQTMPADYGVYNVPMSYRDRYYDTPDAMYRYNDGYIYQADPKTQLITAVIDALV